VRIFFASCISDDTQQAGRINLVKGMLESSGHTLYEYVYSRNSLNVFSEEERQAKGLLRVFSPRFRHTSAALETDGTCAVAIAVENRAFEAGSTHAIPIGVSHITDIPKPELVTTLLIESPTYNTHTRILMDTPMDPLTDPRHDMPIEDAIYAKEQVLKAGLYA